MVVNRNKYLLEKSRADMTLKYFLLEKLICQMVLEWNSIKYRLSPWKELSQNLMKFNLILYLTL